MNTRVKIMILADYPMWLIDASIAASSYYCVWLTALHEAFGQQDKYEVHWVTLTKAVKNYKHVITNGQHFHILPRARKLIGLYSFYWHDVRLIQNQIKNIQPDLIHAWGTEDCYGFATRSFTGKKILSMQGILTSYKRIEGVSAFQSKQCFYEKQTIKSFDHITVESPWAMDECKLINPNASYQIFEYAVESIFFETARSISDTPCCLFGGTDTPVKNVPMLIEAFSRPELSHIQLLLAGVTPSKHPNLPSNIHALGRVPRDRMSQLISETWCVVHPSLADCAPNIANEARVLGVPVILTENCGSKQHIQQGQSGYIIKPRNIDNLIKCVLDVCQSQEKSLQMGNYNHELCRNKLCKEFMYTRINEIYSKLLQS